MGFIKQKMIAEEARGWRPSGGRFVCKNCIDDEYLKDLVESEAESPRCDYCGTQSPKGSLFGASIDAVLDPVVSALRFRYNDPAAELPFESAEGGFQGHLRSTHDLLSELEITDNGDLLDDICACIDQAEWCERNYFSLRKEDVLIDSWKTFCATVKHNRRYLFLLSQDEVGSHSDYHLTPGRTLLAITDSLLRADWFSFLKPGSLVYRARTHPERKIPKNAHELGPPSRSDAKTSNRLTPAGIPIFYGALDRNTACAEAKASVGSKSSSTHITSASFEVLMDLTVVDLATEWALPSIFDEERRDLLPVALFLQNLAKEVSQPIVKDGREHIEYVPTQVVAEYLRHYVGCSNWVSELLGPEPRVERDMFAEGLRRVRKEWFEQTRVHGIMYRSSVRCDGTCCGLFLEAENCVDPPRRNDQLARLVLDPGSLKTERL